MAPGPRRLKKRHAEVLDGMERRGDAVAISAITLWELATLVQKRRIEITEPLDLWLAEIEHHRWLTVIPLNARIAAESTSLGDDFHKDPADRLIVATARCLGLQLLTEDDRIHRWGKALNERL